MEKYEVNRFIALMGSDLDQCVPVASQERLAQILLRTQDIAESWVGKGPKPRVSYDLEQLQVADYATFVHETSQQQAIYQLQTAQPIRTDELAYLALRSMIGLSWNEVRSEQDILRAAAFEKSLQVALVEISPSLALSIARPEALLPYWGRLSFLRVMSSIPEEHINRLQLDQIACVLLKDPVFNARSYDFDIHKLVGLNFALEPILKGLNRMLLHFFHSQEMAGPRRLERAWSSLAPVVAYFWMRAPVAANHLSRYHTMFDHDMMYMAQTLTASQVEFIVRHEIGHLVLGHGHRLKNVKEHTGIKMVREEFEHAADLFAQSSMRSALYNRLRAALQLAEPDVAVSDTHTAGLQALQDHQAEITGVRLLFSYMHGIDQLGELLKRRFEDTIAFRQTIDSHPSPRARAARLDDFNLSEFPPTSPLIRYAETFFSDLMAYTESLDDNTLAEPLQGIS